MYEQELVSRKKEMTDKDFIDIFCMQVMMLAKNRAWARENATHFIDAFLDDAIEVAQILQGEKND